MNRSQSKIRHIQQTNIILEQRRLSDKFYINEGYEEDDIPANPKKTSTPVTTNTLPPTTTTTTTASSPTATNITTKTTTLSFAQQKAKEGKCYNEEEGMWEPCEGGMSDID